MANKITNWFEREGKLYARLTYRDSDGKRRQKARLAESKSDVPRVLRELQGELAEGGPDIFRHSKTTLEEYLKTWLLTVKQNIGEKTYSTYEYLLHRYVFPVLGKKELQKIRRLDVQALITQMRERSFSPKTVRETHMVLSRALRQAVDWEMLVKNPATKIELPKKTRTEMKYLSDVQAKQFLAAASSDKWGVLLTFALKTGMRPEEYLALRWSDIDLKRRTATVQRVLIRKQKGGGFIFAEPKTPRSRRTIPLSASLSLLLEEHKKSQKDEFRFTYNLVFASDEGTPMSMRNFERRHFKPVLKQAEVPDIRLYDLRHTHATLLLLAGENPKVVSERLGHASVAFTLDTYAHVLPSMQEEATEKLEAILS